MNKKIILACCGLFHYRNYVSKLQDAGLIKQFIYSYKLNSEFSDKAFCNIFLKEYAIRFLQKAVSEHWQQILFPLFHDIWDLLAARQIQKADILHVMLHGTALRTIKEAKAKGMIILGEVVNSHPQNYHAVIKAQSERCGVYSPRVLSRQLRRLENEIMLCDHILAPSEFVAKSFISHGTPVSSITVIPYGANLEFFQPDLLVRAESPLEVVCVAQVSPRKGIHVLLEAWPKITAGRNLRLSVVGHVPREMRRIVDASPSVEFTGPLVRAEVKKRLQRAAIFVLPSFEEGFAVSILEAMACQCAVVATRASGAEGAIIDGQNGMIIEAGDVEGLATAISSLADDAQLREKLSAAALDTVTRTANWTKYVEKLDIAYNKLINV
jgi:glycosyltransferase involved in cell wall biosynthesis